MRVPIAQFQYENHKKYFGTFQYSYSLTPSLRPWFSVRKRCVVPSVTDPSEETRGVMFTSEGKIEREMETQVGAVLELLQW